MYVFYLKKSKEKIAIKLNLTILELKYNLYFLINTMHKTRIKKTLTLTLVWVLGLSSLWVIGNGWMAPLNIEPKNPQNWIVLKQLNLGTPKASTEWKIQGDTLTVGSQWDKPANQVSGKMSQVGGKGNKAHADQNQPGYASVIIAGSNNVTAQTSKYWAIVASAASNLEIHQEGSAILASQNAKIFGSNSAILASANETKNNLRVQADESWIIGSNSGSVSAAGALAIGNNININHNGVFAFNAKNTQLKSAKEHTFIVNADNGILLGKNAPSASPQIVPLQVGGAIRVATADSQTPNNAIVLKSKQIDGKNFSCLCLNKEGEGMSLSPAPQCNAVCGGKKSPTIPPQTNQLHSQCGTSHEKIVTSSRAITYPCAEGVASAPRFNESKVRWEWTCSNASVNVSCHAYQAPKCQAKLTFKSNNQKKSHTFIFNWLEGHKYFNNNHLDTVWSVYYYKNLSDQSSVNWYLCAGGVVKYEELDTVYNDLWDGKKTVQYKCYSSDPENRQSQNCQMVAKGDFVIQKQDTPQHRWFKVEKCPDGTTFQHGRCAKRNNSGSCPSGKQWDEQSSKCIFPHYTICAKSSFEISALSLSSKWQLVQSSHPLFTTPNLNDAYCVQIDAKNLHHGSNLQIKATIKFTWSADHVGDIDATGSIDCEEVTIDEETQQYVSLCQVVSPPYWSDGI